MRGSALSEIDYFEAKEIHALLKKRLVVRMKDQCWHWTGCHKRGLPIIGRNGKHYGVKRLCWKLYIGTPPVAIKNTCGDRTCCNPKHMRDGKSKPVSHGRDSRGERNSQAKLTATEVLQIKNRAAMGEVGSDLAQEFRVTPNQIYHILRGRAWTDVKDPVYGDMTRDKITLPKCPVCGHFTVGKHDCPGRYGVNNNAAKLNDAKVVEIKSQISAGINDCALGRQYDVSSSTIRRIRTGKTWTHLLQEAA